KYLVSPTIGSINVKKEFHVDSPTTNSAIEDTIAMMMIRIEGFMCLMLLVNYNIKCRYTRIRFLLFVRLVKENTNRGVLLQEHSTVLTTLKSLILEHQIEKETWQITTLPAYLS